MQNTMNRVWDSLPTILTRSLYWLRLTLMPSVGVAAVNISALIICIGAVTALWALLEPTPIRRVQLVRVEPANHVVDRSKYEALSVYRRVLMSRSATIQVVRTWVDDGNGITSTVDDWVFLERGDLVRDPVRVTPPSSLNPGRHRYRVTLRWCNAVKCLNTPVEDIEVWVLGSTPVNPDRRFQEHRF